MPEDIKCWYSPSVYDTLERSQCMFRSTALDTVISSVRRQLATEVRESLRAREAAHSVDESSVI